MAGREPTLDAQGMLTLTREECLGMLTTVPVGRLVFQDDKGPIALPVNHTLYRGHLVFRTAAGSKLEAADTSAYPVAFEVDDFDVDEQAGWSVLVRGPLEVVTDEDQLDALRSLHLRPWAAEAARDHWMRIRTEEVTGRRIIPRDHSASA